MRSLSDRLPERLTDKSFCKTTHRPTTRSIILYGRFPCGSAKEQGAGVVVPGFVVEHQLLLSSLYLQTANLTYHLGSIGRSLRAIGNV